MSVLCSSLFYLRARIAYNVRNARNARIQLGRGLGLGRLLYYIDVEVPNGGFFN